MRTSGLRACCRAMLLRIFTSYTKPQYIAVIAYCRFMRYCDWLIVSVSSASGLSCQGDGQRSVLIYQFRTVKVRDESSNTRTTRFFITGKNRVILSSGWIHRPSQTRAVSCNLLRKCPPFFFLRPRETGRSLDRALRYLQFRTELSSALQLAVASKSAL